MLRTLHARNAGVEEGRESSTVEVPPDPFLRRIEEVHRLAARRTGPASPHRMTGTHLDSTFLCLQFDALDGPRCDYTQPVSVELGVLYRPLPQTGKSEGLPQATPEKAGRTIVGPPHFRGSPRRAAVFLLDLALLLLGQEGTRWPTTRVEAGHDPRLAPPVKPFSQPARGDSPASGQLSDRLKRASPPVRLADQPLDPTAGPPRHERDRRCGTESLPPPRPPPSTGGQVPRDPARTRN